MILKVSKSGADTGFMCRTTVPVPFGSLGVQLLSIDLPSNAGTYSPAFSGAVTANGNVVAIPAQGSLEDLIDYLNGIDAPNRALFVYLHDNELEICSGPYAVVFSGDLVAYFGLPSANLAANDCTNVTLHREKMNPVAEYIVDVTAPIDGVFHDGAFTETIGFVKGPKGLSSDSHFFRFTNTPAIIRVAVYYRMKANGALYIASCDTADRWSVTLRIAN